MLFPKSKLLWKAYLAFRMSSGFVFSAVMELFDEVLQEIPSMEFVLMACGMLKHSGYLERAIGIFQALIELEWFTDSKLDSKSKISGFEAFWENESARFGEVDALGWGKWRAAGNSSSEGDHMQEDEIVEDTLNSSTEVSEWCDTELEMMAKFWQPARGAPSDPYRCVLFDDISAFLYVKPSNEIIYLFMEFLGFSGGLGRVSTVEVDLKIASFFKKKEFPLKRYPASLMNLWDIWSFYPFYSESDLVESYDGQIDFIMYF